MAQSELRLLGTPTLILDGAEVRVSRRKAMALLAYLAVTGRTHTRDALATLLWPEADPSTARGELRRRLSQVNRLLGGDGLDADRETVRLNPDLDLWLDVAAFRDHLARSAGHDHPPTEACPHCLPLLEEAAALYSAGFMAGFSLEDSAAFDDWQFFQAEALRDEAASALVRLATYHTSQGDLDRAIDYARCWLAIDPLHEPAHRHLMVLYARSNQRAAALRQFEKCQRMLQEELGAEPSDRTREVYDRLLSGETPLAPTAVEAILERELRTVGPCPYRGLAAFREADAPFFHGRESFCERLTSAVSTQHLVAMIVGASGSGKSSVIYAGLLPRLREQDDWAIADLRPGSDPFHALATAFRPLVAPDVSGADRLLHSEKLANALRDGELDLHRVVVEGLAGQSGSRRLLLLVDQFEELYTLCPDPDIRRAFIDTLLAAVDAAAQTADFTLLITLRADFMGQALGHRPFADALQAASQLLGPMTRDELRDAIEKPADAQGAAFEAGLVERLLDDVADEPGHLPLLEFALTLLWERLDFGWLTHAAYEQVGRVEGALARYAQQVFDTLPAAEQLGARRVFTQLVQPGEGTEDTRRVATRAEVGQDGWQLVQHLANQRLVVTGRDELTGTETVEVVHEALIANWGQLQAWMNEDRAFRTWQERLRVALRTWEDSGRDEGALLRGSPLAEAEGWLAEREEDVSNLEAAYVRESVHARKERQAARDRRRRRTVVGLLSGLAVAVALTALTLVQRRVAIKERAASQVQAAVLLAGQAETELANGYHDRAVLLALAALEQYPYTPQAEHALGQAVSYRRALQHYTEHTSAVTSASWSPDGTRVATTSSTENRVDVWDPVSGEQLLAIDLPTGITGNAIDMALNVQWTPDSSHLLVVTGDRYALGSQDYDVSLWDATTGKMASSVELANASEPASGDLEVTFFNYPTSAAAAVSAGSGRLATLGGDNTAIVWDEDWKHPAMTLDGHTASVNSVDWSPDETRLATAGLDGAVIVWDVQTGQSLTTLAGHEGRIHIAAWSPDGSLLATGGEDGVVRIWEIGDGTLVRVLESGAGVVGSLTWAPNGVRLVSGHDDGSLRVWETATGELLQTLLGHDGSITDLAWSPVDDELISTDGGGGARVWNLAPSTAWRLYPPQAERGGDWTIQGADWTSDSRYLALAGGDVVGYTEPPSFEVWDVVANELIMQDLGDALDLMGLQAFWSPDDTRILYIGLKGFPDFSDFATAYVFDAASRQIVRRFTPGNDVLIRSVAWSPDGSLVATGLFIDQVVIWDYETGEEITRLDHPDTGSPGFNYVEFSPDGTKLATAGGAATIWDTSTWKVLTTVAPEPPADFGMARWSPDGTKILTGAGNDERGAKDTRATIWDAVTGEPLTVFEGHTKSVWPGSWSPNGSRVATFGNEGAVRVWDASTGDELLTLEVPVLYGVYASWSPDGKHLSVVGTETENAVWRVWQSPEELLDYARECCVFRELTSAERAQFGLRE